MRYLISSLLVVMSASVMGCMAETEEPTGEAELATTTCPEDVPVVTRTQGFWQNHSCVIAGAATGRALVPFGIGESVSFSKAQSVTAYLDNPVHGKKQLILGHQLVASKLNVAAFGIGGVKYADWNGDGALESVNQLLDIADSLYETGSAADQVKMATILDKLNNSGDAQALYFDPTCKSAPVAAPPACE